MITSKDNQTIKLAASLLTRKGRDQEGRFIIEGQKLVKEALAVPGMVEMILIDETVSDSRVKELKGFTGPVLVVAARLGKTLSATETPQGIWAICQKPEGKKLMEYLDSADLVLILAGIQDPGNLGTMLRTAWSVGVDAVLLTSGTVDIYNPKVIRAAMGAVFSLPVIEEADLSSIEIIKQAGFKIHACTPRGDISLFESDFSGKAALMIGSEGNGIPDEYESVSDYGLHIPLQSGVESLNAAVACGIILYEAYRQKRLS